MILSTQRTWRKKDKLALRKGANSFLVKESNLYYVGGQVLDSPVGIPLPPPLPTLPAGAVDFHNVTTVEEQRCLDHTLNRLRERMRLRRILAKPVFQDFDWHHLGHITCHQLGQCLSTLGLEVSEGELALLGARFKDAKGIDYLKFLCEVQPAEELEDKYSQRITQLTSSKENLKLVSVSPGDEADKLQEVLEKIKIKVSKKRARIQEFLKDYDKLRTGRVSRTNFARGLDLCAFELTPQEVALLQNRYCCPHDPGYVEYLAFSDDIESVFTTKGLEKTPTVEVQVFVPPVEVGLQQPLTLQEEESFERTMRGLAKAVRVCRIQLYPLFEDYDRVKCGSVTKTQFQRVLSELNLAELVDVREMGLLL